MRTVVTVCAINSLFWDDGPFWDFGEAEYELSIPVTHWYQPDTPQLTYAAQRLHPCALGLRDHSDADCLGDD